MSTDDPTKRIPKSLGTETKLYGTYTLTDVGVALGPAVVVVLILQVLLPASLTIGGVPVQSLTVPIAAVMALLGAVFVSLTPPYQSSLDWIGSVLSFYRSERQLPHEAAKAHTLLQRVRPDEGLIERTDGAFVGMLHVDPPSMALATDAEWRSMAAAFEDVCNTLVEFPIQLYSTTQTFPVEQYLAHYTDRLADPDVKANPRLATLIEDYVDWYAADIERRRMTIRDHYVVVSVSPEEVHFERESLLQQLAKVPLLGLLVEVRFAPGREEQRAAMVEALDERLRRLETGLRDLEGCHASRVTAETATQVITEFWAGAPRDYGDVSAVLRTKPIIGGGP